MKNCVIYKITNPSGHSYVGKSVNWKNRYGKYKHLECKDQPALYNSFVSHGFENHTFEILQQNIPEKYLNGLEMMYIWAYRTFLDRGHLNCTEGGDGSLGYEHTEESRKKISEANSGRPCPEEVKKKLSEALSGENSVHLGKHRTDETKSKISKTRNEKNTGKGENHPLFGTHRSDETKQKISKSNTGKVRTIIVKRAPSSILSGKNHPMFGRKGKNNPNFGKTRSQESKNKMSTSRTGLKQSQATIQKRIETRKRNRANKHVR